MRSTAILGMPGMALTRPDSTTMKSSQFQPSRKYAPVSIQNPMATTFMAASMVKRTVNTTSLSSTSWLRREREGSGSIVCGSSDCRR